MIQKQKLFLKLFFIVLFGTSVCWILESLYFLMVKLADPESYFQSWHFPFLIPLFALSFTIAAIITTAIVRFLIRKKSSPEWQIWYVTIGILFVILFYVLGFLNFRVFISGIDIDFYSLKSMDFRVIIGNFIALIIIIASIPLLKKLSFRLINSSKINTVSSVGIFVLCVALNYLMVEIDPNKYIFKEIEPGKQQSENPNVILFIIDNLRADYFGCYGDTLDLTPNIDRIASKGVLYKNAYSASSWTAPSFAAMFTSKYPYEIFITEDQESVSTGEEGGLFIYPINKIDPQVPTLASAFKDGGYYTASFQANYNAAGRFNFHLHHDFFLPCYNQTRKANLLILMYSGIEKVVKRLLHIDNSKSSPFLKKSLAAYCAEAGNMTDYAVNLIKKIDGQPFFMVVNYMDVHEYTKRYPRLDIVPKVKRVFGEDDIRMNYAVNADYCDKQAGRIYDFLAGSGLLENTILLITSDHGEQFDEHGFWGLHGCSMYDEEIRIPLIFHYPRKLQSGEKIDRPVSNLDLFPSLAALAGIQCNTDDLDGVNFFEEGNEKNLFSSMTLFASEKDAMISYPFKVISNHKDGSVEIYNLSEDPLEKSDIFFQDSLYPPGLTDSLKTWQLSMLDAQETLIEKHNETNDGEKIDFQELKSIGYIK